MARLVLCLALFVVGAIGQEVFLPGDSIIDDERSEVRNDIPQAIPEDNSEIIPTSGNFAIESLS